MNFSNLGPSHEVQSFRNRLPSVGTHGVTSPARKPALAWTPLSMGSQNLLQHGLSTRSHLPSGASTCSHVGSSIGCRWLSASLLTSLSFSGTAYLIVVFTTGCRGISAPAPAETPHPPALLTLVSAGLFLSPVLTPLSGCSCTVFFPHLRYAITELLPLSLIGSAFFQRWFCLGAGWHWLCWTEGKHLASSHRSHRCSPSANKTSPRKPNARSFSLHPV